MSPGFICTILAQSRKHQFERAVANQRRRKCARRCPYWRWWWSRSSIQGAWCTSILYPPGKQSMPRIKSPYYRNWGNTLAENEKRLPGHGFSTTIMLGPIRQTGPLNFWRSMKLSSCHRLLIARISHLAISFFFKIESKAAGHSVWLCSRSHKSMWDVLQVSDSEWLCGYVCSLADPMGSLSWRIWALFWKRITLCINKPNFLLFFTFSLKSVRRQPYTSYTKRCT